MVRAAMALSLGSFVFVYASVSAEVTGQAGNSLFSEQQAVRGSKVLGTHCAVCHGAGLTGGGGSPPLQGPDFIFGWSSRTTRELVDYIATKMPPGQAHSLTAQEYEDVSAYILSANGFKAGDKPLSPAAALLIGEPPEPGQ